MANTLQQYQQVGADTSGLGLSGSAGAAGATGNGSAISVSGFSTFKAGQEIAGNNNTVTIGETGIAAKFADTVSELVDKVTQTQQNNSLPSSSTLPDAGAGTADTAGGIPYLKPALIGAAVLIALAFAFRILKK